MGLCLRLHPGSIQQPQVLEYLRTLKRYLRGRKAILLWDRLPAHRGGKVQAFLRQQVFWLTTEYLPPYAPELNPVEYFWAHLSGADLANFVGDDLQQVRRQARAGRAAFAIVPNLAEHSSNTVTSCNKTIVTMFFEDQKVILRSGGVDPGETRQQIGCDCTASRQ